MKLLKNRCTDTVALKKMMIDNNISTINELSAVSHINRNTLSKVLSGETQPSADAIYKLVLALNIPYSQAGNIFFGQKLT